MVISGMTLLNMLIGWVIGLGFWCNGTGGLGVAGIYSKVFEVVMEPLKSWNPSRFLLQCPVEPCGAHASPYSQLVTTLDRWSCKSILRCPTSQNSFGRMQIISLRELTVKTNARFFLGILRWGVSVPNTRGEGPRKIVGAKSGLH